MGNQNTEFCLMFGTTPKDIRNRMREIKKGREELQKNKLEKE